MRLKRGFIMQANSRGQDLAEHLMAVSHVSAYLSSRITPNPVLIEAARLGGLLHDIGKASATWQSFLSVPKGEEGECDMQEDAVVDHRYPYHHEVSWALVASMRDTLYPMGKDRYILRQLVEHSVYWHHAKPVVPQGGAKGSPSHEKCGDVLRDVSGTDIGLLDSFLQVLLPNVSLETDSNPDAVPPPLYEDEDVNPTLLDKNAIRMVVRGSVITADRYVSQLSADEVRSLSQLSPSTLPSFVLDYFRLEVGGTVTTFSVPSGYDANRFGLQVQCAQSLQDKKTVAVRAPAGFGKTMLGVLFNLMRGRRTYWVCPRNVVARSVYDSVVKELSLLGYGAVSVELYYTSSRQASVNCGSDSFRADIVVTNLDNFLKPVAGNDVADRMFLVMASDVVFDEYHEFVGDSPLYAAFITLMRLRNLCSLDARTILLSATPSLHHELWSTPSRDTVHLPSLDKHYPAAHGQTYSMRVQEGLGASLKAGEVLLTNSIRSSQAVYKDGKADRLVHSNYTPGDRAILMGGLMKEFGKHGARSLRVASAPVIQASMDISFRGLYDSVLSPDASLQRFGRCNRWGDLGDGVPYVLCVAPSNDKSEMGAIRTQADEVSRKLWIDHMKSFIAGGRSATLDTIYTGYNQFHTPGTAGYGAVLNYLKESYLLGVKTLKHVYPRKFPVTVTKDKADKKSGASLRSPDGSYYYAVTDSRGQWVKDLFSADYREVAELIQDMEFDHVKWSRAVIAVSSAFPGYATLPKSLRTQKPSDRDLMELSRDRLTPLPVYEGYVYEAQTDPVKIASGDMGLGLVKG